MPKENYAKPTPNVSDNNLDNTSNPLVLSSSNINFKETNPDDDRNSKTSDFLNHKLIPSNQNLKSILKNPKHKKKKHKISFEEGNISEQELENLRIKEIILKGKLDTFKSVFEYKLLNVNDLNEKHILLKKHKKDIADRQREIHIWSTRAENVHTTGWSFEVDDPDERVRTKEEKTRLPKSEGKIHRQKVKYETRIDTLRAQYQDLINQEAKLESEIKMKKNKVKEKPIPSFVRKLILKSLPSHTKKTKQLKEVLFQKTDCKTALNQQIFEQKNHQAKFPTYYRDI